MSVANRLDILVFGATGYTGQYVVEELARKGIAYGIKWGVAGRTVEKLKETLQQASNITGIENLSSNIATVVANVDNKQSLIDMCCRAKILINCVGPYRLYGEPVVEACLEAYTHYIDISGEPQFLETIQYRYDTKASQRQIAIVGSCGFDSLIADLGVEMIRQEYEKANLDIAFIESFLSMKYEQITGGLIHYATWHSAVYGFSHANELKYLRRQLFQQKVPYSNSKIKRNPIFQTMIDGKSTWAVPFPGSDKSVVQRTQYFNYTTLNKKPIRFQPYMQVPTLFSIIKLVFFGVIFSLFTKFKIGIKCLLKFPRFFSAGLVTHDGPTRADCDRASFKMTFVAQSETKLKTIHEFAGIDAGYLGTSKMAIGCAFMLLKEYEHLPVKGGVLTPAAAFGRTSLINYLDQEGISFRKIIYWENVEIIIRHKQLIN